MQNKINYENTIMFLIEFQISKICREENGMKLQNNEKRRWLLFNVCLLILVMLEKMLDTSNKIIKVESF